MEGEALLQFVLYFYKGGIKLMNKSTLNKTKILLTLNNNHPMNSNIDVIRLPAKDSAMIEKFVQAGEFQNKSEFVTYAVKKAINEIILKEIEEKSRTTSSMEEKDVDNLLNEIKDIRKKLWEGYAHRVF